MRKLASICIAALTVIFLAGCHDGYSTYSFGYRSGPICPPVHYHDPHYDHGYVYHHHHSYRRHYHGCDY